MSRKDSQPGFKPEGEPTAELARVDLEQVVTQGLPKEYLDVIGADRQGPEAHDRAGIEPKWTEYSLPYKVAYDALAEEHTGREEIRKLIKSLEKLAPIVLIAIGSASGADRPEAFDLDLLVQSDAYKDGLREIYEMKLPDVEEYILVRKRLDQFLQEHLQERPVIHGDSILAHGLRSSLGIGGKALDSSHRIDSTQHDQSSSSFAEIPTIRKELEDGKEPLHVNATTLQALEGMIAELKRKTNFSEEDKTLVQSIIDTAESMMSRINVDHEFYGRLEDAQVELAILATKN